MEVIEKAPAKVNLILDILGKRDDGFHEMEMIMTSIDLADRLTFKNRNDSQINIFSNSSFMPLDERNIVHKTAILLRNYSNVHYGADIYINKNIPIAAGLGGGSSDAAATLRGLNELWQLNVSTQKLAELGAEVGSDVPYCIHGRTAFAHGRGENIELIDQVPSCWVVLVKPPKGISSWTVFQDLDVETLPHFETQKMIDSIKKKDYEGVIKYSGNALEEISAKQQPMITQIKEKMLKFGADTALMSGTGPTVLGLTNKRSKAERMVNALRGFCDEVYLVRTLK